MTGARGRQSPVVMGVSRRTGGFTLFELVVVILLVAILFTYAFNRFRDYPAAAERANFLAVQSQISTAVNLRMMAGIASDNQQALQALEGSNPMQLLLERPRNYIGEFTGVDVSSMPRRVWYFDSRTGELVYLASDSSHLYRLTNGRRVPADSVRLRITMEYEEGSWQGLSLRPVEPYVWEGINDVADGGRQLMPD